MILMPLVTTSAALPLAFALTLGGTGTAVNGSTDAFSAAVTSASASMTVGLSDVAPTAQITTPATASMASAVSVSASGIKPMVWGSVIKILTSKPACIAARDFYNTLPFDKVKCVKLGKVWAVVPR